MGNTTESLKAALQLVDAFEAAVRDHACTAHTSAEAYMQMAKSNLTDAIAALAQTEQPEPCKNCPPGHKCDHYGCMRGRFTAPSQAEQPTVAVQTAWEWAGGNPGIKATAEELKVALQELDKACDEKAEPAEKAQPEPITLADVLDALNVFNKPRPGDGDEPWTEEDFISVKHLPAFLTVCYAAWYAAPPAAPQPAAPRPEFVGGDLEMLPEDLSALRAMVKAAYRLAPELRAKKLAAAPQPSDLERESAAVDFLLRHVGLDPERCRTEGGAINLGRVRSLLSERAHGIGAQEGETK